MCYVCVYVYVGMYGMNECVYVCTLRYVCVMLFVNVMLFMRVALCMYVCCDM